MTSTPYLLVAIYLLVLAGLLVVTALATWTRLVRPALSDRTFSIRSLALDVLGAAFLISITYEALDAYFSTGGLMGWLAWWVQMTIGSLGLVGVIMVIFLGLALRFYLRLSLVWTRRRA